MATEAAIACRDYALNVLDRRRLVSIVVPENLASRCVAEKIGMHLDCVTQWKAMRVCIYALDYGLNS